MKKLLLTLLLPLGVWAQTSVQKNSSGVVSNGPVQFGSGNTLSAVTGATVNFTGATQIGIVAGSMAWSGLSGFPNPTLTITGDATGSVQFATTGVSLSSTVVKINGTSLAGLATGLLYNTTATGVPAVVTLTGGSIAFSAPTLSLSGDTPSPGIYQVYGTNNVGTRAWRSPVSDASFSNSSGTSTITPGSPIDTENCALSGSAGARTIIIATTTAIAGARCDIVFTLPATSGIAVTVRSGSSGGAVVQTFTTTGSAAITTARLTCNYSSSQWNALYYQGPIP